MTFTDPPAPREAPGSLPLDREPARIAGMFDAIAGRYDLLNRLLSAGLDRRWRARAVAAVSLGRGDTALDLCTGTADLALTLVRLSDSCQVIGVDFSQNMLALGHAKVEREGFEGQVRLLRGDAVHVPIGSAVIDAATIGFGIRNVQGPVDAIEEVYRVLRPGGRLAVLEFGYPRSRFLKAAYLWYFRRVLPFIGRFVSRHESAYRYLPASVGTFWEPEAFRRVLEGVGFVGVRAVPLTAGVVYLFEATKPTATVV